MQSPSWRQERRSLWKLRIFDGREGPLTAARALENVLSFVTVRVMFRVAKFSASFPGRGASFPVTVRPTRADVSIVPFSGKRQDAFPSGHALHKGALASAAGSLPALPRRAIRVMAVGLSLTRVVVLAHWASDVVAGFALGAVLERALRLWTGYPGHTSTEDDDANP
jgi:membrane-associated phospholipid phosphatase